MRHADVEYFDSAGRPHRPQTVPLTALGRQQAQTAATALSGVAFDLALTSGLLRTEQTARIVLTGREVPLEGDSRLREIETGRMSEWANASPEMVMRTVLGRCQATFFHRQLSWAAKPSPRSLSVSRMPGQRCWRSDWRTVLVVAHGVVNRMILSRLLAAPLGSLGKLEQDACCVNLVEMEDAGTPLVRLINWTADNPLKLGMHHSTLEGLYRQFLQGRTSEQ